MVALETSVMIPVFSHMTLCALACRAMTRCACARWLLNMGFSSCVKGSENVNGSFIKKLSCVNGPIVRTCNVGGERLNNVVDVINISSLSGLALHLLLSIIMFH